MKKLLLILAACAFALPAIAQNEAVKSSELKVFAGVPVNGTSTVQTLTFGGTITGGAFTVVPTGYRATSAITWSATNATLIANIQTALNASNSFGSGNATVAAGTLTSGIGTVTITYAGTLAKMPVPDVTVTSALTGTGPTLAAATTTPGVRATFRNADPGQPLIDGVNGFLYVNQSTVKYSPNWVQK